MYEERNHPGGIFYIMINAFECNKLVFQFHIKIWQHNLKCSLFNIVIEVQLRLQYFISFNHEILLCLGIITTDILE